MNDPISVQTQDISESMNFFEEEYENEEYENEEYDNDVTFEYDYEALERIYAGFEPSQKENERLGICMKHFNFDQRQHGNKVKSTKPITNDDYLKARCLFCNKIIFFFCRGGYCNLHSWSIQDKNIQVPCNGQVTCHALD